MEAAEKIVSEGLFHLLESADQLRMGQGVYFFMKASPSGFAQQCATGFCKAKFRRNAGTEYAVLRCFVECEENSLLDLYKPELLEQFHEMRYALYNLIIQDRPDFELRDAGELDTMVINRLKKMKGYTVIRAPEYFAPLLQEEKIKIQRENKHRFRKTYLPNVLMLCVDVNRVKIDNIEIVEQGIIEEK